VIFCYERMILQEINKLQKKKKEAETENQGV
jgi:hypothetical protein